LGIFQEGGACCEKRGKTVHDLGLASTRDHFFAQSVDGTPDLVCVHPALRTFLAGLDEHVVVDVVLLAALLAGGAFRYGTPPVTVRVELRPPGRRVRLEVDDHRRYSTRARPFGYRVRLLSRVAHHCGLGPSDQGGTRAWAEITVTTEPNGGGHGCPS
jgi:hypothetical protein